MKKVALAALVLLGACVASAEPPSEAISVRADGGGLQPIGTPLRIDFGRAELGAVAAVSKLLMAQPVKRETTLECGAGPITAVSWSNGFTMNFQRDAFVGWTSTKARGNPVRTTSNIIPGQERALLGAITFQETSLGTEFQADDVFGLIKDEEVELLWAGTTCFFR